MSAEAVNVRFIFFFSLFGSLAAFTLRLVRVGGFIPSEEPLQGVKKKQLSSLRYACTRADNKLGCHCEGE